MELQPPKVFFGHVHTHMLVTFQIPRNISEFFIKLLSYSPVILKLLVSLLIAQASNTASGTCDIKQ